MKIDDVADSFGKAVRRARENRRWTQADLAQRLGAVLGKEVNPLAVTRIESGKRPVPLPEVAALAGLLNLEIDPLINPAPVRLGQAELVHRAEEVRSELDAAYQEEVRLMAASASANQQLRQLRMRQDGLERELQAIERATTRDGEHGKQEHQEAPER
ncbi:helix-turn-helix domain-containing protein [Actinacidiphila sp. ITFR-21]|uniref:helix-turn-helix domain-containing protein n=1 Tax=Actinacidiphila sp. ITFR-21 TaxID=3075199 RepID=UPI00288BAA83|nr:helix-turn-helix transcriptional regulator [Streptomyces sp. ITFR-21]WNI15218.1 helix-turn-helix transcriptional regulator [Streptomyces sp. ITFR-21]